MTFKLKLIMASTIDGKIAKTSGQAMDWSDSTDKKFFSEITKKSGVVIMGNNTFKTINKPLPDRINIIMTREPVNIKNNTNDIIFTNDTPENIICGVKENGFSSACLIGGSQINSLFLQKNMIDEIYITIVPQLFGTGLSLFNKNITNVDHITFNRVEHLDNGHMILIYNLSY